MGREEKKIQINQGKEEKGKTERKQKRNKKVK